MVVQMYQNYSKNNHIFKKKHVWFGYYQRVHAPPTQPQPSPNPPK